MTSRLPNSIAPCRPSAPWGTNDSSVQRGQVGQPSPEAVSRTTPPVITMRMLTTRVVTASGYIHRRARLGAVPGGRRVLRGHSHLNVLEVSTVPTAAQAASTTRGTTGSEPSVRAARSPLPRAPEGSSSTTGAKAAVARRGDHHRSARHQQQVDQVGRRQRGLRPQRAGERQSQGGEGGRAEQHRAAARQTTPTGRGAGAQPRAAAAARPMTRTCSSSSTSRSADLAGEQPGRGAGERRPAA